MSDLLLIPGFATELNAVPLRPRLGPDGGFSAFREHVASGAAVVFRWGIEETVPKDRLADPRPYASLYRREREAAASTRVLEQLSKTMETVVPRTIVCHSMGCFLLLEYVRRFGWPASVARVVFVQADIAADEPVPDEWSVEDVLNLYCPWDPALAVSASLHQLPRAGQVGWNVDGVKNRFTPLWRPWNLHTSSIRDPKLVKIVEGR